MWNPECPVAGHTKCKGSREEFETDFFCGANARLSAQVCTIGHTCTGSCICTKLDTYSHFDFNPDCPVSGHSGEVISIDFSPDGQHFVSGSLDNLAKIWNTVTGTEVNSSVGLRLVW